MATQENKQQAAGIILSPNMAEPDLSAHGTLNVHEELGANTGSMAGFTLDLITRDLDNPVVLGGYSLTEEPSQEGLVVSMSRPRIDISHLITRDFRHPVILTGEEMALLFGMPVEVLTENENIAQGIDSAVPEFTPAAPELRGLKTIQVNTGDNEHQALLDPVTGNHLVLNNGDIDIDWHSLTPHVQDKILASVRVLNKEEPALLQALMEDGVFDIQTFLEGPVRNNHPSRIMDTPEIQSLALGLEGDTVDFEDSADQEGITPMALSRLTKGGVLDSNKLATFVARGMGIRFTKSEEVDYAVGELKALIELDQDVGCEAEQKDDDGGDYITDDGNVGYADNELAEPLEQAVNRRDYPNASGLVLVSDHTDTNFLTPQDIEESRSREWDSNFGLFAPDDLDSHRDVWDTNFFVPHSSFHDRTPAQPADELAAKTQRNKAKLTAAGYGVRPATLPDTIVVAGEQRKKLDAVFGCNTKSPKGMDLLLALGRMEPERTVVVLKK